MGTKRKGGGGKLSRTETVTIRLDPKLKFAADLAARKHRRTLSSYIEWAIEKSLSDVELGINQNNHQPETVHDTMKTVWSVDEADRFMKLAWSFPSLLNHDEEVLLKLIFDSGWYWKGKYDDEGNWEWQTKSSKDLIHERFWGDWVLLKKVANGELSISSIPKVANQEETKIQNEDSDNI